jgi:hypothetical protein
MLATVSSHLIATICTLLLCSSGELYPDVDSRHAQISFCGYKTPHWCEVCILLCEVLITYVPGSKLSPGSHP